MIQDERRKELGFEFHRFFDLMRWGKATAEAALGGGFEMDRTTFLFSSSTVGTGYKHCNNPSGDTKNGLPVKTNQYKAPSKALHIETTLN